PPCSGPARPEHRPAATSRRSLQACIASLSLQSSLMSKTYLKSDHFNGGGSASIITSATIAVEASVASNVSRPPKRVRGDAVWQGFNEQIFGVNGQILGPCRVGARYERQPT